MKELLAFAGAVWEPADVIELRAIHPTKERGAVSVWVSAGEIADAADWGNKRNREGFGIYAGANPRKDLGKSAENVALARCLFVDFDGVDVGTATALVADKCLPLPTAVVASGHGCHCWWRLAEAMTDLTAWSGRQRALIALLGSDRAIHDPPRVMRLPGWWNTKEPRAVVELVESRDSRYGLEQFPEAASKPQVSRMEGSSLNGTAANLSRATLLFVAAGAPEGERNARLFSAACDFAGNGLDEGTAEARLLPVAASCGLAEAEARQTIRSAYSKPRSPARPVDGDAGEDRPFGFGHSPLSAPPPLTDLGNAERFERIASDSLRYCHSSGRWYAWDGARWKADEAGSAIRISGDVVRDMGREIANTIDPQERAKLAAWAWKSEDKKRIQAIELLGRSRPLLVANQARWDTDPMILNVRNGTLDLRTGTLRDHSRADMLTKLAPAAFNPEAECPRFDAFLARIFEGKPSLIGYVQRFLGMCLTGVIGDQILVVFHGEGANGKSVLIDTVLGIMGDYASIAAPTLLIETKHGEHPTEVADLIGRRLVISSESESGGSLKVQQVKRLTGDATLKGRFMRQDFFTFQRTHKLLMVTNNRPHVRENTEAIWRRIKLVPFAVTIPEAERDPDLLAKLAEERPGILAWLVRGCLTWQRDGLGEPGEVSDATDAYRSTEDAVGRFLGERCVVDKGAKDWFVPYAELRREYEAWARESGETVLGDRRFRDGLDKAGLPSAMRRHAGRVCKGRLFVRVADAQQSDLPPF